MSKTILIVIILVALIGFADTSYLSAKQYVFGQSVPCAVIGGCEQVLTSSYAKIGPIPLAFFGLAFYLAILFLAVLYWEGQYPWIVRMIRVLTILGFAASLVLLGIQAFILNAYCTYCLISAGTSTALFLLAHNHRFRRIPSQKS